MPIVQHEFTPKIIAILNTYFPEQGDTIFKYSEFLQYLNIKTRSANRGSKSRSAFANHYAIYVLIEDYLNHRFHLNNGYKDYEGAQFKRLLKRQRELPFGSKLQNHALNHRLNEEFKKYFPALEYVPIIRDTKTNRYWINENLINLTLNDRQVNIAEAVKEIIETYIGAKQKAFNDFINYCQQMIDIQNQAPLQAIEFIRSLLTPEIDARIFEIVSYAILKEYFGEQKIYWGWSLDDLSIKNLTLYKTGRTNANDGGIDFVMKPLGRFFQVTETVDASKYFLDIDKVQRYPITFVVKTEEAAEKIRVKIEKQARSIYNINRIVERYMNSIEEIINIPELLNRFEQAIEQKKGQAVIEEIVLQSRVEFNIDVELEQI